MGTPHKCDEPINGHFSNCDRSGCSHNTRYEPTQYGPGGKYTIDTTRPFKVHTYFPEERGILVGMVTTLSQAGRKVVLNHSSCEANDLAALSKSMVDGMSLRITYRGESMDAPPCGQQACSASTAGNAVIEGLTIHDVMWVVADPQDELFGHVVPKEIVENTWLFTQREGVGVAKWHGSMHQVRRQTKPASSSSGSEDCDDDSAELPCRTSLGKQTGFANAFVKKFLALPSKKQDESLASPLVPTAVFAPLLVACLFGVASTLVGLRLSLCHRRRTDSGSVASKADSSGASSTSVCTVESLGVGAAIRDGGSQAPDPCLNLGSLRYPSIARNGSSCQRLLTLAEKEV